MTIDLTGSAQGRKEFVAWLMRAKCVERDGHGNLRPLVSMHIHPLGETERIANVKSPAVFEGFELKVPAVYGTKFLFNLRIYGTLAEQLQRPMPEDGWEDWHDFADRTSVLEWLSKRQGETYSWKALPTDETPPGYEDLKGVRLYDASLIATPINVFA